MLPERNGSVALVEFIPSLFLTDTDTLAGKHKRGVEGEIVGRQTGSKLKGLPLILPFNSIPVGTPVISVTSMS